jgi:hypothetical protein
MVCHTPPSLDEKEYKKKRPWPNLRVGIHPHTNTPNDLREQSDKKMRPKPKTKRN